MRFENFLFEWAVLTLLAALILGGKPWKFPKNGSVWIQQFEQKK